MTSKNEVTPLQHDPHPARSVHYEGPKLSPTCEREHMDPASYSPLGFCLGCAGAIPAGLTAPAGLAILTTPIAYGAEAEGAGVRVTFRGAPEGAVAGPLTAFMLGVPEAHNLSDVLALAAASSSADATDEGAAAAVFGSLPSWVGGFLVGVKREEVWPVEAIAGWAAAAAGRGRVVLGFVVYQEPDNRTSPVSVLRFLIASPKELAAKVLRATCLAQAHAQELSTTVGDETIPDNAARGRR